MNRRIPMVQRACPVCGSRDETLVFAQEHYDPGKLDRFAYASRKVPEHMHYRLVECPSCDLLYATPLPRLRDIARGYQEAAYDSSEESHFAARTYGKLLEGIVENLPDRKGALDIGTGDGAFLEVLLKAGFTGVRGSEPSKAPIQAALSEIRPLIQRGLFRAGDFKKNSMGLVTCFQAFEHLYDPLKICQEAFSLLREGGAFLAVCHNRRSFSAKLLGIKSPIFDIEHLQLFSPGSARFMLEKAGFTRVEAKPIFNAYPLHYWVKLLPLPRKWKPVLMALLKAFGIGRIPFPLPAGNIAVVGYKGNPNGRF